MTLVNVDGPALDAFIYYTGLLVMKTLFMEVLVWIQKFKILRSQFGLRDNNDEIRADEERISRIKRAHFNDIENIPIFIAISLIYVLTRPDPETTALLLKVFTFARIFHTIVYAIWVIPQPARAICFVTGEIIMWYMIVKCIMHFSF